jgi:hypothetical protein
MAKQGWLGSVALGVGAGAVTAAAQFGLGYGFGVIKWSPDAGSTTTADNVWLASLGWTLWIAATSTVIGAIAADRGSAGEIGAAPPRGPRSGSAPSAQRPSVFATAIWRALLAVAAAVGSLLSVVLVLAPAHAAGRPDTASPHLIAAGYAVVGVTIGIVLAVCALAARSTAANVIVTTVWLWLLAAGSVTVQVIRGNGYTSAALEVWPFGNSAYFRHTFSINGAILMLGTAFVIGVVTALPAMRRTDNRIGVVLSGAAGPLLVAAAYVLTIPALVGVTGDPQASASIVAPYALLPGLAGSGLIVLAFVRREAGRRAQQVRDNHDLDTADLRDALTAPGGALAAMGKAKAPQMPPADLASGPRVPAARKAADGATARIPTSPKRPQDPDPSNAGGTPPLAGPPSGTDQPGATPPSNGGTPGGADPNENGRDKKRGRRR